MQPEKYDVVVVGAGIGGLGVGALLAHSGYKTLVVEKCDFVGGRFSSYEYEGFTLPTGAVTIHYKDTETEQIFKEVGAELELIDAPTLFYRIAGKDYEMPPKGAIGTGLDIINRLEEDKAKVLGGFAKAMGKEKILGAFRSGTKEPDKEKGITFKDWLLQYTDNEMAHGIFDTIVSTLAAAHSYEISAQAVFSFFVAMKGFRDVGIPARGNRVNMENLAKAVKANGDVWTNCLAKRIVVERGRAKGIVVEKDGGEVEIEAQVVLSNVGPKATVELIGEDNFKEDYLRNLRVNLKPKPVTMVFVASDRPLWPEDGRAAILMVVGARRITSVIPLSSISPQLAPPGQHLLFAFGSPVSNEVRMDVEVEQEQILKDIKEQFPLFEKHGRVIKFDSRNVDDELPEMRTRVGIVVAVETPVKDLYNVGDGCPIMGYTGSNAAAETAVRVAGIVRKQYKPGKA
ncbi:MAG TPA: NAD(P)-binding protein [Dehalococcoidia bacterium]|nr:NAD(P)-binding protein [Dehalococcoidia bacterium]